ncbi:MAG: OmpA family protein, partial [Gemmatimonadota bacterium]
MTESLFIPDVIEENSNGIFARHPIRATLPVLLATTTDDRPDDFNTARKPLITVACANLSEFNFQFDSSFIGPTAVLGFDSLARIIKAHPGSPMSVFGHADPTGKQGYNKHLSERRARAVFGVMINDPSIWVDLFLHHQDTPGDNWGPRVLRSVAAALGGDPGEGDAALDSRARDAIRKVLGLGATALVVQADPKMLLALFTLYFVFIRGAGFPTLGRSDFLGTTGQKAAFQGCSEFNPQLLLSRNELAGFEKGGEDGEQARNDANEPNRRVLIFLFAKGSTVDPKKWP